MDRFAELTGRRYGLFDYVGASRGRAGDRADGIRRRDRARDRRASDRSRRKGRRCSKSGCYRPFSRDASSPRCRRRVRAIAVLDRTKEPGASATRLSRRVDALAEAQAEGATPFAARSARDRRPLRPVVEGVHAGDGQGGLRRDRKPTPKSHFTVGIVDDVTHRRCRWTRRSAPSAETSSRAVFYGLGADGTVGANKNSIKIIGEETDLLRAGLLRLRLEEVGRDDHLAPALEPAADPLGVSRRSRRASSPATSSSSWTRSTCSSSWRRARSSC